MVDIFINSDGESTADVVVMPLKGDLGFTLKNMAAEEFRLQTGLHSQTLDDLQTLVELLHQCGRACPVNSRDMPTAADHVTTNSTAKSH